MMQLIFRNFLVLGLSLGTVQITFAQDLFTEQARRSLEKATDYLGSISTNGGYVGIYSLDLKQRFGESKYEKARTNEIWVQPPGTPSVGKAFLHAYNATNDKRYLTAARNVARALAWGQRQIGGWDHRVRVDHLKPDSVKPERAKGRCTYDDNISQEAISFLMALDQILDEAWLTESVELGLQFMLKSQFANGAWPQWYPLRGGYHNNYTFNDNSINDCIRIMIEAHIYYGKKEYLDSARRGGDFMILSQWKSPQAGWAQQYDLELKPSWARSFEPPGICSAATGRNIRTLVNLYLYTKDKKYLKPISPAIDWLKRSQIKPNLWGRLYEVGSNKPVYGDRRDGNKIHYEYDKISAFERTHYSWQSSYGIPGIIAYYEKVKQLGPERFIAQRDKPLTASQRRSKALRLAGRVKTVIAAQDTNGRWKRGEEIHIADFVTNLNTLSNYLKLVK
jgi:pectate lyase-like protein